MTNARAAEMLRGGENEKIPAANWQLTIVHPDADEDYILPGTMTPDNIAALLRLIVATKMRPAEIVSSFLSSDPPAATTFAITEKSFEEGHLLMECQVGAFSVFAVKQTAPALRH